MNLARCVGGKLQTCLALLLFADLAVAVEFAELGLGQKCRVRDLWSQKELGEFQGRFAPEIKWHGAGLYCLAGPKLAPPAAPAGAPANSRAGVSPALAEVCYLFSYFVGNGEDGLHLAWSRDGYRWETLNGGRSLLKPEVGESKLMRDPCLLRAPGGTFHMVWTTAWNGRTIGYAASKDLLHWSEQKALLVMADEPATLNCWAPEVTWDGQKEQFLIFWASTVTNKFTETASQAENHYNHRMYCTTTKDFQTFGPTRLYYDPGFNVIDATLLRADGRFRLLFKDETVKPPRKQLRMAVSDLAEGPFGPPGPPFTPAWVEGPTALRLGDQYIVYFDCYRDQHYGAMTSKDLVHWQDVTDRLAMPPGARHGTVLHVPGTVLAPLLKLGAAAGSAPGLP